MTAQHFSLTHQWDLNSGDKECFSESSRAKPLANITEIFRIDLPIDEPTRYEQQKVHSSRINTSTDSNSTLKNEVRMTFIYGSL